MKTKTKFYIEIDSLTELIDLKLELSAIMCGDSIDNLELPLLEKVDTLIYNIINNHYQECGECIN